LFRSPPLECDRDADIARCVRGAAAAVTGAEPEEAGVAYWMDAAIVANAGVPTVNYGPAGAGAHAAVDWVDVDSVVTCARVTVEAARPVGPRSTGRRARIARPGRRPLRRLGSGGGCGRRLGCGASPVGSGGASGAAGGARPPARA